MLIQIILTSVVESERKIWYGEQRPTNFYDLSLPENMKIWWLVRAYLKWFKGCLTGGYILFICFVGSSYVSVYKTHIRYTNYANELIR